MPPQQQQPLLLCPPLDDGDGGVMSVALRSKFEALKKDNDKKRKLEKSNESNDDGKIASSSDGSNDSRSSSSSRERDSSRQKLAHETAVLAQTEVKRLQNSVADLEALLAQRSSHGASASSLSRRLDDVNALYSSDDDDADGEEDDHDVGEGERVPVPEGEVAVVVSPSSRVPHED